MFMPHRRGKFAGRNSEKLSLKSAVRPGPAQQKISDKTKLLLNKTREMYIHAGATIRTIIIRMRTRRILFQFKLLSVSTVLLLRRGSIVGSLFWGFFTPQRSFRFPSATRGTIHESACGTATATTYSHKSSMAVEALVALLRFFWLHVTLLRYVFFFSPHREIFFSANEALRAKNVKILPKERSCTAAERRVTTTEPDWGGTRCEEVWKGWGSPSRPRLWENYRAEVGIGVRGWSPSCEEGLLGWRKQLIYWCRWWDWCHCQWRCYSCWGTRAGWSTSPSSGRNRRPCRRWAGCWGWSRLS